MVVLKLYSAPNLRYTPKTLICATSSILILDLCCNHFFESPQNFRTIGGTFKKIGQLVVAQISVL